MADEKNLIGQKFDPEHLKGSGTILPDGTYGEPEPDPTEKRGLGPDRTAGGRLYRFDRTERQEPAPKKTAPKLSAPKS